MQKLYCYVDESGQDTKGEIFVVGIVILEQEREKIEKELERIEAISGKKTKKWHKAPHPSKKAYFEELKNNAIFRNSLFFKTFTNSKQYIEMTSYATAKAILRKVKNEDYKATIFIDGFKKREIEIFIQGLKDLHIKRRKVRGVKKEESSSLIHLADMLCGLVRDADEENKWASRILSKLKKEDIVIAI